MTQLTEAVCTGCGIKRLVRDTGKPISPLCQICRDRRKFLNYIVAKRSAKGIAKP